MAGRDPSVPNARCERAQLWASLRLDGELSTVEDGLLERHLAGCETCRAFEARMRSATANLRGAEVERPMRHVRVPAPRTFRFTLPRARMALVAVAALGLGALAGSFVDRPSAPVRQSPRSDVSYLSRDLNLLRELPRGEEPEVPAPTPSRPPNPPEGVI